MDNKIEVIVVGNTEKEHQTYVERDGIYYKFWDDGWEGIPYWQVISFLKFLKYEVLITYKNKLEEPLDYVY